MSNDARIIRDRHEALDDALDRDQSSPPDGCRALLIQTTIVTTYPTVAQAFYAVQAVDVDGPETEGSAANFSIEGPIFFAANLGTAIPPQGAVYLLAEEHNGKWAFRFDG